MLSHDSKPNLHIPAKSAKIKIATKKPVIYVKWLPVSYLYTKFEQNRTKNKRARAILRIVLFLVTAAILVGVAS